MTNGLPARLRRLAELLGDLVTPGRRRCRQARQRAARAAREYSDALTLEEVTIRRHKRPGSPPA